MQPQIGSSGFTEKVRWITILSATKPVSEFCWLKLELASEHMRKPCSRPHEQPLGFCATIKQKLEHRQQAEHRSVKGKKSKDAEEPHKVQRPCLRALLPPRRMKRRRWADSIPTLRHLHDVWGSVSPKNSCYRGGGSKMLKHQAAGCPHWKNTSLYL